MTVFMVRMRYFKMDREKGITASYSQILDYWDEDLEISSFLKTKKYLEIF